MLLLVHDEKKKLFTSLSLASASFKNKEPLPVTEKKVCIFLLFKYCIIKSATLIG